MTTNKNSETINDIRTVVRDRYGEIATKFNPTKGASCCSPDDLIQIENISQIYETPDAVSLPEEVVGLSLGCGDPVTLASLKPGQTVLDLGSGGGIDCFLAAQRVGSTGRVIGVDMTAEMIEKARANKVKVGAENVEFRLGEIEHLPVADNSVDVIISNCVINLSPDKPQVFREAYRVLRPGGKLAVSDIITDGPLPQVLKENLNAWAGCIAGALDVKDYIEAIEKAGFVDVELQPVYLSEMMLAEAADQLYAEFSKGQSTCCAPSSDDKNSKKIYQLDGEDIDLEVLSKSIFSAKVTARKP